jgi:hypothetical protein
MVLKPDEFYIMPKPPKQYAGSVVGNVALFYICFKLSQFGWNVIPTSRNSRGADILIYSQDGKTKNLIQVKGNI